jgi:hypothetical protein
LLVIPAKAEAPFNGGAGQSSDFVFFEVKEKKQRHWMTSLRLLKSASRLRGDDEQKLNRKRP